MGRFRGESCQPRVATSWRRDERIANAALERHLGTTPTDLDGVLPLELQKAARRTGYSGATTRVIVEVGAPARFLRASCMPLGDDGAILVVVGDVTEARHLDAVRR